MIAVIGDILPLAVTVASNPLVVILAVLLVFAPHGKSSSFGYLAGWLGGLIGATSVLTWLTSSLPGDSSGPRPLVGLLMILSGAVMIVLGWRKWSRRPAAGEEADLPQWMSSVDNMSVRRAATAGLTLSLANPKNLMLIWSACLIIGSAGLGTVRTAIVSVVFVALAASSVAVPVVSYRLAPDRVAAPMGAIRDWLVQHNVTILALLLWVMGVMIIGKGMGKF